VRDIGASVEVRALIGADKLRELHGDTFARYECWQCGRTGRTIEPTSVIVLADRVFRVVKLAHAGCAGSQILEVGPAGMSAVAGDLTHRHNASRPGEPPALSRQRDTRHGGAWHEDETAAAQAGSGR
jgi:hypothetical protein